MIVFSLLGLNQVDYQQNNQVSHLRHKIQSGHYHLQFYLRNHESFLLSEIRFVRFLRQVSYCNVMHKFISILPIISYIAMQCNAIMERLGYRKDKTILTPWESGEWATITPVIPSGVQALKGFTIGR